MNKNKGFRFQWIQDILYGKSKIKNLLSKLIKDSNLRYKLKSTIEKINLKDIDSSENINYKKIPTSIIDWNNNETSQLEKITNLNLKEWYIS